MLMYFGIPQLGYTIKANFITFQNVDPDICSISIFYQSVWD